MVVEVSGDVFLQLGLVVVMAALIAFLFRLFRQPQILAYVLTGVLLTPVFHLITDLSIIESMSLIGVAFLLFLVGMEMDLKSLRNVTLVSTVGGSIQLILLFVLGYGLAVLLGFFGKEAFYLGLFLAFSSTMVVMKLLSDRREIQTLHGRIIIGILLIEDIVAIFALSILSSANGFTLALFITALLKFISLFAVAFLASKYLFPGIFRFAASHQELLFISSLGVCFLFALAFSYWGFSLAIGAFLAGLSLGNLSYRLEIISKMKSLRDFFALLFFVSLGMQLSLGVIKEHWVTLLVLLLLILFFKPLIIMTICSLFKYTKKPAFLTANALAQMGEFSLILAAQGLALGHITSDLFSLVVLLVLITITATSYFIKYEYVLYRFFRTPLSIFDRFTTEGLEYLPTEVKPKIVLCGYNRIGFSILRDLQKVKKEVLIIDYNPEVIDKLVEEGYHCLYGDVADEEIAERMNLRHAQLLISTVPGLSENLFLIKHVRRVNRKTTVIVTASDIEGALKLYEHGANYVILPHFLGGEHVAKMISKLRGRGLDLQREKKHHLEHIRQRKLAGHEHPQHE